MYSDFARYEDESLNIEWNITLKKTNFLPSLTPKNVFHVMNTCMDLGKMSKKILIRLKPNFFL